MMLILAEGHNGEPKAISFGDIGRYYKDNIYRDDVNKIEIV